MYCVCCEGRGGECELCQEVSIIGRVGASPRSLAAGACCLYISADRPTGYGMTDWIPYISKCFYMNIL